MSRSKKEKQGTGDEKNLGEEVCERGTGKRK